MDFVRGRILMKDAPGAVTLAPSIAHFSQSEGTMIPPTSATSEGFGPLTDGPGRQAASPTLRRLRPGPLAHALDRLSIYTLAACFAFPQRFNRATARLSQESVGGAVSPRQASAYFGATEWFCGDHRLIDAR